MAPAQLTRSTTLRASVLLLAWCLLCLQSVSGLHRIAHVPQQLALSHNVGSPPASASEIFGHDYETAQCAAFDALSGCGHVNTLAANPHPPTPGPMGFAAHASPCDGDAPHCGWPRAPPFYS